MFFYWPLWQLKNSCSYSIWIKVVICACHINQNTTGYPPCKYQWQNTTGYPLLSPDNQTKIRQATHHVNKKKLPQGTYHVSQSNEIPQFTNHIIILMHCTVSDRWDHLPVSRSYIHWCKTLAVQPWCQEDTEPLLVGNWSQQGEEHCWKTQSKVRDNKTFTNVQ